MNKLPLFKSVMSYGLATISDDPKDSFTKQIIEMNLDLWKTSVHFTVDCFLGKTFESVVFDDVVYKLPFPNMAVQLTNLDDDSTVIFTIAENHLEDHYMVSMVVVTGDRLIVPPYLMFIPQNFMSLSGVTKIQESFDDRYNDENSESVKENRSKYRMFLELLRVMMTVMSCDNVKIEAVGGVKESVNNKRIKKGKMPIYETNVLVICNKTTGNNSGFAHGSERNSPRVHLRRGHIRRLFDERGSVRKRVWVKPVVVGDKTGVIDKSYEVRP